MATAKKPAAAKAKTASKAPRKRASPRASRVTITVDAALLAQIDKRAQVTDRSRAEVIRELLDLGWFGRPAPEVPTRRAMLIRLAELAHGEDPTEARQALKLLLAELPADEPEPEADGGGGDAETPVEGETPLEAIRRRKLRAV